MGAGPNNAGVDCLKPNIILIGMPGAGKSTIGVLLAKVKTMGFVDTDLLIQNREDIITTNFKCPGNG